MSIAVVHDYFTQEGGAEKVAAEMYGMFPGADLFTTVMLPDRMPAALRDVPVHTSWMQRLPAMRRHFRLYFLLYPLAVRSLGLASYSVVLTSSSGYAKGVRTHFNAMHICYCHTPPRWLFRYESYVAREKFGPVVKAVLPHLLAPLRRWDAHAARMPDHFLACSQAVADRIFKAYGRSAEVIYPPIDVDRFHVSSVSEDYYIVLARLAPYKRIDLAVEACTRLGKRLIVIGSGPDSASLRAMAGPTIEFMGRLSDTDVEGYVSRCRALIFPGEEDFGMAPLEVAAAGRPTIAYRAGGAMESIRDGETGLFFDRQTPEHLMESIERFERMQWDQQLIRRHALTFSTEVFQQRLLDFLDRAGAGVSIIPPSRQAAGRQLGPPRPV
jgi:glycosyltransferase involved in cell wall biosynthesis